jgi:hypothetical protein
MAGDDVALEKRPHMPPGGTAPRRLSVPSLVLPGLRLARLVPPGQLLLSSLAPAGASSPGVPAGASSPGVPAGASSPGVPARGGPSGHRPPGQRRTLPRRSASPRILRDGARSPGFAQVRDLTLQGGDLDVPLLHGLRDPLKCLIGDPHVVAPDRRGRAEQRHVRRRHGPQVGWGIIRARGSHLTTTPRGDDHDGHQDGGGRDKQDHRHSKNRATLDM